MGQLAPMWALVASFLVTSGIVAISDYLRRH